MNISLRRRHTLMGKDGALCPKIDYIPIFGEILNCDGHLNRFIHSKATVVGVTGRFYLVVELHWEGSAHAACAAGFLSKPLQVLVQF